MIKDAATTSILIEPKYLQEMPLTGRFIAIRRDDRGLIGETYDWTNKTHSGEPHLSERICRDIDGQIVWAYEANLHIRVLERSIMFIADNDESQLISDQV
jgi:hypothetical protein